MNKKILGVLFLSTILAFTVNTIETKDSNVISASVDSAEISAFEKTSGSINEIVSYAAYKGNGLNSPKINALYPMLTLSKPMMYTTGNYIKISCIDGYAIDSVTMQTKSSNGSETSSVFAYSIGSSSSISANITTAYNAKYTINDIKSNSINIYNTSGEFHVTYLNVTYYECDENFEKLPEIKIQELFEEYVSPNNYTKETTINLDSSSESLKTELAEHGFEDLFHAKATSLNRITYYYDDELLMTNKSGTFTSGYGVVTLENLDIVQSLFADAELGDMTHFTYDGEKRVYDYIVKKTHENWSDPLVDGMEGFYVTPKDFLPKGYFANWKYDKDNNLYSINVTNKDKIVEDFLNVVAPLVLNTILTSNYINVTSLVIKEVDESLVLQIISSGDSGKLIEETTILAEATITKGCERKFGYTKGLSYELSSDGESYVVTGKGTTVLSDIIIPSSYNGKPVTEIKERSFYGSNITGIVIPDSITKIGSSAFQASYSLKNVKLSKNIKGVSYRMFLSCKALENIIIPEGVVSIDAYAFEGCTSLKNISIPESISSISVDVFKDCTSLNYNTYDNAMYLGNESNPYVVLFKANNSSITSCKAHENTKYICSYAFKNCESLKKVVLNDGLKTIGNSAFYYCSVLSDISLPSSVTYIGDSAFYYCKKIPSLVIPEGVTQIYSSTFYNCESLATITIPYSVISVGRDAFAGAGLKTLNYTGTKQQFSEITIDSTTLGNNILSKVSKVYNYVEA